MSERAQPLQLKGGRGGGKEADVERWWWHRGIRDRLGCVSVFALLALPVCAFSGQRGLVDGSSAGEMPTSK